MERRPDKQFEDFVEYFETLDAVPYDLLDDPKAGVDELNLKADQYCRTYQFDSLVEKFERLKEVPYELLNNYPEDQTDTRFCGTEARLGRYLILKAMDLDKHGVEEGILLDTARNKIDPRSFVAKIMLMRRDEPDEPVMMEVMSVAEKIGVTGVVFGDKVSKSRPYYKEHVDVDDTYI